MGDIIRGRIVGGRIEPWGGACQCHQCIEKKHRSGFWIAKTEEYEAGERTLGELDRWTKGRVQAIRDAVP